MQSDYNKLTIGLAGDVMIGRGVDKSITQKGYSYPWGNVLPVLNSTDINIINLETTLTNSNRIVEKIFNFKATPDKVITLLRANITLVNLANNHILDFSEEGLKETINVLDEAGIKHVGAGMNAQEAAKPEIIFKNNIRVGVVGFTDNEPSWKVSGEKSGTNYINISKTKDKRYALDIIQRAKERADILVVSIHWGYNMQEEPSSSFIHFAHEIIANGADIIHGHSAHIFQAIEIYQHKLILYDTGDFGDDYIVHDHLRNDLSFFFLIKTGKQEIDQLNLIPIIINNCQVNLAANENYRWSIKRI
jgi:poly-gamma-glutamate capsule biosynthesis protein CapA/YwtB (metallophosphatase superfamily)